MANEYATVAQLRQRLRLEDSLEDSVLSEVLEGVSREIDDWCQRRFYSTTETRVYTPLSGTCLLVDDLLSVSANGLKTDGDGDGTYETTWATTDYWLGPENNAARGLPYWELRAAPNGLYGFPAGLAQGVQLTGVFGFAAATPPVVRAACLDQAALVFRAQDAPMGTAGGGEFQVQVHQIGLHPFVRRRLARLRLMVAA